MPLLVNRQNISLLNPFQNQTGIASLNTASLYPSLICLNVTKVSDTPIAPCDAQIEVFQIQVKTDTGVTESYIFTIGTNINPVFSNPSQLSLLRPYIDEFSNAQTANIVDGYFFVNSTLGQSLSGAMGMDHSDPTKAVLLV